MSNAQQLQPAAHRLAGFSPACVWDAGMAETDALVSGQIADTADVAISLVAQKLGDSRSLIMTMFQ
ncbi:MAG: hypothetical protein R3E89_18135 [Thiolinea sp.]